MITPDVLGLLAFPFFQRALVIGVILGILMACLGVLVVLRRLSFFADAIGHSALTGIALGILLSINPFLGAFAFALLVAASIALFRHYSRLHLDTLLGVFFPASVSLGVILVQLSPGFQTDLIGYLFGDILTVSRLDVWISIGLAMVVTIILLLVGKKLLTITLDESLAHADGIMVAAYELLFMLMLAAVIALSIKLVGIILVTAMLVIPAASAQNIAASMTSMFVVSIGLSMVAAVSGMILSAVLSVPSGPAIVLTAAFFFAISFILRLQRVSL